MTDYTRLIVTGRALIGVGAVAQMARDLQPSVVALEDVDLVAQDRFDGPQVDPVLFDLLDAMDGAAPTPTCCSCSPRTGPTSSSGAGRPSRPGRRGGRGRPADAPARERLLALYGRGVPLALTGDDVAAAVERTDGTTASFLKELIRRSVLEACTRPLPGRLSLLDSGPGWPGTGGDGACRGQRRAPDPGARRPARHHAGRHPDPAGLRRQPGGPACRRPAGRRSRPAQRAHHDGPPLPSLAGPAVCGSLAALAHSCARAGWPRDRGYGEQITYASAW